jgi:hypothetical protein
MMRASILMAVGGLLTFCCACGGSSGGKEAQGCPASSPTTVSGVVHAPNGTLPVFDAWVYVPAGAPPALSEGTSCRRCGVSPPGAIAWTRTGPTGSFRLLDVPSGTNVPVVVEIGGWRRVVTMPSVVACADNPLPAEAVRLPRSRAEGRLPRLALSTGGGGALECLLRKLGIADSEFSTAGGAGRVHLYAGGGGTDHLDVALGGGALADSTALWSDRASLDAYETVILSCEGSQHPETKPAAALQAMLDHVDGGGRVLASHWHNYWLQAGPPPWPTVATFNNGLADLGAVEADVPGTPPRGASLAQWLLEAGASVTLGKVPLAAPKHTVTSVAAGADAWLTVAAQQAVPWFSFTAPFGGTAAQRCGRLTFTDLHGGSGDVSAPGLTFPSGGCTSSLAALSPEEKVLLLQLLETGRCVE